MEIIEIMKKIAVFMLLVEIPSGRVTLTHEDLAANGIDTSLLPPDELATLGQMKVIDPKDLAIFTQKKKKGEKVLSKRGTRFMGRGYSIPYENIEECNQSLLAVKKEFDEEKVLLLATIEAKIEDWAEKNPAEWAPRIRSAAPGIITRLTEALNFGFAPFMIITPEELKKEDGTYDNPGLDEQVTGLFGQLCHEVRVAAKESYEESFVGRDKVTRKALNPIIDIRNKMSGLSFLDPSIGEAITIINEVLDQVKTTPIEGKTLDMVAGLVGRRLSNFGRPIPIEPEPEEEPEVEELDTEQLAFLPNVTPPAQQPTQLGLSAISWDF